MTSFRLFRAESHKSGCNFLIKSEVAILDDGREFMRKTQENGSMGKWEVLTTAYVISNVPEVYQFGDCMKLSGSNNIFKEWATSIELPKLRFPKA